MDGFRRMFGSVASIRRITSLYKARRGLQPRRLRFVRSHGIQFYKRLGALRYSAYCAECLNMAAELVVTKW